MRKKKQMTDYQIALYWYGLAHVDVANEYDLKLTKKSYTQIKRTFDSLQAHRFNAKDGKANGK